MRPTAWLAQSKTIATMVLSQNSVQALNRLRNYTPPPTQWYNCPLTRRAAVLILLFADRNGELKVVLTMRSPRMRSYAGQVALPGGKSDTLTESPFSTARREAFEEIGLPQTDDKIPGFSVEHICELPASLAKTELGVRPCVAFLYPSGSSPTTSTSTPASSTSTTDSTSPVDSTPETEEPSVEEKLIPRLNPGEVAAVFTAPFQSFLRKEWSGAGPGPVQKNGKPEKWYSGSWTEWNESRWRMHNFYIPRPLPPSTSSQASSQASSSVSITPGSSPVPGHSFADDNDASGIEEPTNFRVWGMTARILVDAARLAYGQEPEFQHNSHFGDEALIERLLKVGRMDERVPVGEGASREVVREASKI